MYPSDPNNGIIIKTQTPKINELIKYEQHNQKSAHLMTESTGALDNFLAHKELSSSFSIGSILFDDFDAISIIKLAKSKFHHHNVSNEALESWKKDYQLNNPQEYATPPKSNQNNSLEEKSEFDEIIDMKQISAPHYAWNLEALSQRTIKVDNFIEDEEEEDYGYIPSSISKATKPSIQPTVHSSSTIANDLDMEDLEVEDMKASNTYLPSQFVCVLNPEVELPIEDLDIDDDEEKPLESIKEEGSETDWIRFLIDMSKSSSQYADILTSLTLAERKDALNVPWEAVSDVETFQWHDDDDDDDEIPASPIEQDDENHR